MNKAYVRTLMGGAAVALTGAVVIALFTMVYCIYRLITDYPFVLAGIVAGTVLALGVSYCVGWVLEKLGGLDEPMEQ
jgi:hypothetical protein